MTTSKEDFFIPANSVYNVTDEEYERIELLVNAAKAFARSTYQCVYIINYFRKDFLYVSDNVEMLCGEPAEKVKEFGYELYLKHVPEEEQRMLPEDIEMKDTLGNVHHLQELRGKYILLDFWFSGCAPCIESFPEMKEISEQMADSLEVVSISQDSEKEWRRASAQHGITWHNWNDLQRENGIFARFGANSAPYYFLVSPEGKLIASKFGYGKGSLFKFVKKTIAEHSKQ